MNSTQRVSILAIGTELTTGQITNRNAAWISERLNDLGLEVVLHETVADDREMIRNALDRCSEVSSMIFTTGGLGPTTDDFTREVIAEWLDQPLEFHSDIWDKIKERLTRAGIGVAESNRQQCYFPARSQILQNPEGTAPGFWSHFSDKGHLWVLPGPPREVAAIWKEGVDPILKKLFPHIRRSRLLTWQCLGKSEAELGEMTEQALSGSGLQTGYRAQRPYIEIKVWCPETELQVKQPWIRALDQALAPWVITRQGEDLAKKLLLGLRRAENIDLIDAASGGYLASRISTALQDPVHQAHASSFTLVTEWSQPTAPEEWVKNALDHADEEAITLILAGFTPDGKGTVGLRDDGGRIRQESFQLLSWKPEFLEKMRQFTVEIALKKWWEWLESSIN